MNYDQTGTEFFTTVFLDAGEHAFKIASGDWSSADFGSDGIDTDVQPGVPKTLLRSSSNLQLVLAAPGNDTFRVEVSAPRQPVLVVE